jgi:hypothetical protein
VTHKAPTAATLDLLQDFGQQQAKFAYGAMVNCALKILGLRREAAKEYGLGAVSYLAQEIKAGTFTHLDDAPCLVEVEPEQLTFGGEA